MVQGTDRKNAKTTFWTGRFLKNNLFNKQFNMQAEATRTAFLDNFNPEKVQTTLEGYCIDEKMLEFIMDKYKKMIEEVTEIKVIEDNNIYL